MVRLGYAGIALNLAGSHNDAGNAPEGFNVGEIYFFQADQLYYEVIGVQGSAGTTIHYLSLTIPQAEGTKTYTLVLNFDLNLYQLPPRKITHE